MTASLARVQRSLGDPDVTYPLFPPLTAGCPRTSTDELAYPLEVDYAYDELPAGFFANPARGSGLDRWAALLPPLTAPGLGEGGTPLVSVGDGVYVKDESRNPTWSHKDRLNRCTVSAAVSVGAPGVVVASSGNHGASAAAYAARAGLPCVVFASAGMPPAVSSFLQAYGAVVLPVPAAARWPLMRRVVEEFGFHPVSNLTVTHTGHPFGPEGYKTIAYEIVSELGSVPSSVFVPTGYGELLYGVWKGFVELRRLGVVSSAPRLFSCESRAGAPLAAAFAAGTPTGRVEVTPNDAYSIASPVSGYRALVALRDSGGAPLTSTDAELRSAAETLAHQGLWYELSSAAGLAGYRSVADEVGEGPVVCIATSSGFKDKAVGRAPAPELAPDWPTIRAQLKAAGLHP